MNLFFRSRRHLCLILVLFSLLASCKKQEPAKLVLSLDMVINEVAKGNAALLVDETGYRKRVAC
jgi:hypothetical protein